ncbi:MAG: rane protein [Candidatus Poribacteria bacterium]|nr:rane protein [Candidatus Poribacteria bacterium]
MMNYNLIKNVIKKYLQKLWQLIWETFISYYKHNCANMAAGMSFYGLMSLIPLVIVGVSTLGYIIGSSENAQKFVSTILYEQFPVSAKEILDQIDAIIISPESSIISFLSLIGLIWSGMKFFNILQSVLNSIWVGASQRRFLWGNVTVILIFMAAGFLFWLSFAFDWLLKGISELNLGILNDLSILSLIVKFMIPFITLMIMTFLSYLFIPNAKISTMSALIGSFFTTVFLELYKWAFSAIIVNFSNYGTVYGSLAGIIIFMSWLYMSMSILLVGAELGSQCQQMFFDDAIKQR